MWAIWGSQNAVWIGGNVWRVMGAGYLRGAADSGMTMWAWRVDSHQTPRYACHPGRR